MAGAENRERYMSMYFREGFQHSEIAALLESRHHIHVSTRTVRRVLKRLSLTRRKAKTPLSHVINQVIVELKESGSSLGYRSIHQRLIEKGVQTDRETIRICLNVIDPVGVELRSTHQLRRRRYYAKGPNYIWHIDGNDKLKPFGFCIHGCIDGYSRRILWLEVSPSNKNPRIIARYFLNCVKSTEGLPRKVRADRGSENVLVAGIQRFLRRCHTDSFAGYSSFAYGKSVSNQRIECWWSHLKKCSIGWWRDYFKSLRNRNMFDDSNPIHTQCLKFCFYGILQDELDSVKDNWNHHKIRPNKYADAPHGKPDLLYFLPGRHGTNEYKTNCNRQDVLLAESLTGDLSTFGCSGAFSELALLLMKENFYGFPTTKDEAELLYLQLVEKATQLEH
eukprot:Seg3932.3 transcript_id=Seg3932.3/GoldUCD/mRNA.D3Y31 product="hypothetical protein" protein_id=Seg3932.3/GoldUCD/D3Y31